MTKRKIHTFFLRFFQKVQKHRNLGFFARARIIRKKKSLYFVFTQNLFFFSFFFIFLKKKI